MNEYITKFDGTEYRFLSNFYPSLVEYDGEKYNNVEAAYQASKTNDKIERTEIRVAQSPALAKKLGRKVSLRPDWEEVKASMMLHLLRKKFLNGDKLTSDLLLTGDKHLVEGNCWHDNFFGVCYCEKCMGQGKNVLGQALMLVREEAREKFGGKDESRNIESI